MREALAKNFSFSPLRLAMVVLFLIGVAAYYGYQRWEARFDPKYREAVPPEEQADGNLHYTLYHLEVNEGPAFYVPWKLGIPKEIYVELPESSNDGGPREPARLPNTISFSGYNVPNNALSFYLNPDDLSLVTNDIASKMSGYERRQSFIDVYLKSSFDNRNYNWWLKDSCQFGKEIYPRVFEYKSQDGKRKSSCEYLNDDEPGIAYVFESNIIAKGKCRPNCIVIGRIGRIGRGYSVHIGFQEEFLGQLGETVDILVEFLDSGTAIEGNPDIDRLAEF